MADFLTAVLANVAALMAVGVIFLVVLLCVHLASYRRERRWDVAAPDPLPVPPPDICPICGDGLLTMPDVSRVYLAARLNAILNDMEGVSARVHARADDGICFSIHCDRRVVSEGDLTRIGMLAWWVENPQETVYLDDVPLGPYEEVF